MLKYLVLRNIVVLLDFRAPIKIDYPICICFAFLLDTTVYIPSFDGTSYLELQPLLQPSSVKDTAVALYLTVKTRSTQGTILYSEYSFHRSKRRIDEGLKKNMKTFAHYVEFVFMCLLPHILFILVGAQGLLCFCFSIADITSHHLQVL